MEKDLKDLLLRDLCARLSYGVKVQYYDYESERVEIDVVEGCENMDTKHPYFYVGQYSLSLDKLKPVLYPLSSMAHEQKIFLKQQKWCIAISTSGDIATNIEGIDWLNKNFFDHNGLIEKGLAIDATNLNVY